jgi:5-methylcytosine-specific restriction enzyme A
VIRPNSARRGYGAEWRKFRALQLARFPYCAECGCPATVVDHSPPYVPGTSHGLYMLTSLCARCHNAKTGRELGAFARRDMVKT